MENSLTVPLLLAATATATGVLTQSEHRGWACGVAFALAGLTRVDFAALLLPALLIVVAMLWRQRRDAALRVGLVALCSWGILHAWRWLTFRTLLPNSALAQDKRAMNMGNLAGIALGALAVGAVLLAWHRPRLRVACAGILAGVGLIVSFSARWTHSKTSLGRLPKIIVIVLGGLTVLASVAWALAVASRRVWAPLVAIGLVPLVQELIFGPARLDSPRIGAQSLVLLAPVVGILGATLSSRVGHHLRSFRTGFRAPRRAELVAGVAVVVVGALGVQSLAIASSRSKPYNLCCEIRDYATTLDLAHQHADRVGLPRSITAVPDLGKFSFGETDVVVDLGRLGDALLAEIRDRRPDLVVEYLNLVSVPDFIEIHGMWACNVYPAWLASPEFEARYDLSGVPPARGGTANCSYGGSRRYYERSDDDPTYAPEIALAAELASHPTDAEALVTAAADQCKNQPDRWACQTVRRAIQRAAPELRQAGTFDDAVAVLGRRSPTGQIDELLLDTPPGWANTVAPMLISLLEDEI
jgi:hypothetical protein